jgi:hypothetical protein
MRYHEAKANANEANSLVQFELLVQRIPAQANQRTVDTHTVSRYPNRCDPGLLTSVHCRQPRIVVLRRPTSLEITLDFSTNTVELGSLGRVIRWA